MCTYTSGYFPIDDDEYGCIHYDDDDHVSHSTQGFADLQMSLWTTSSTMMGPKGYEPPRDSCSHVWVVCKEVLHIQFCPS